MLFYVLGGASNAILWFRGSWPLECYFMFGGELAISMLFYVLRGADHLNVILCFRGSFRCYVMGGSWPLECYYMFRGELAT